ncbi:hypothetical protein E2C01_030820 [Portunus trituberculatus]|uniref:Uncharacterized protein n=1 Tax=Portunus trituberculatus TaxID=210409 RepID=A0A5B7EVX6_PORTR|nr:hypothetical protein [Portunus trituberculatus]
MNRVDMDEWIALYSEFISLSIHYTSPPPSLTTLTPPPRRSSLPASFLMVIACGSPAGGKAPGPPLPGQPGRGGSLTSLRRFSALQSGKEEGRWIRGRV